MIPLFSHCRGAGVHTALCLWLLFAGCRSAVEPPAPPPQEGGLPDFSGITDVDERKLQFFTYLRPLVEEENERIRAQRRRLHRLHREHVRRAVTSSLDQTWLSQLLVEYGVEGLDTRETSHWDNLLRRVDIVPPDLAMIQAAKESGWGTSRFAKEGNNLYGERCFVKGCGIVPGEREEGAVHEVATFPSVRDSVRSYIRNLNTNSAYRRFRRLRFRDRGEGRLPEGYGLVDGLPQYSERREEYLNELKTMLRSNRRSLGS